uniref:Uncharacterized protein n=1 Tax=Oryza sativa subsp. japonica TaxID=39947 RepID=Q84Q39_ORYSJ|nr:hypothetical protein [Oryza sativa Japonica Group]BAD01459.1 hypothetical protein [Oryza sativa Japonica Group]
MGGARRRRDGDSRWRHAARRIRCHNDWGVKEVDPAANDDDGYGSRNDDDDYSFLATLLARRHAGVLPQGV